MTRPDIALLKTKIAGGVPMRDVMLGKRWTQPEALAIGLVDEVVDAERLLGRAVERGAIQGKVVAGGAWGLLKVG